MVLSYTPYSQNSYGRVRTASISGASLSLGSEVVYNSVYTATPDAKFLSNSNTFVVAYKNNSTTYGEVRAGEVSGTSITVGSAIVFNSSSTINTNIATNYGVSSSFLITFREDQTTGYTQVVAGTASGTSIDSTGSAVDVTNWYANNSSAIARQDVINKFLISVDGEYLGSNPQYGIYVYELTVAGVNVTIGTKKTLLAPWSSGGIGRMSVDVNPTNQFVVAFRGASNYGSAITGQLAATITNLTATNFVGITSKAISNTATGPITLQGGVSTNQSSLTVGSTYYVQANGTVSTVSTSPAVNIGKALNATTLKLKGLSV
jgi:hypothetical protein